MYKKLALLMFLALMMASCGTQKKAVTSVSTSCSQKDVLDYGMKYLGKPYRYAAKGPDAFDCSGFTSFVFRKFGIMLSPASADQYRQVATIRRKGDLLEGDLVFFKGRSIAGEVGHVGIVKEVFRNGEFTFLHAATGSGVIVSRSTEPYYASRYLRGGRVLSENNRLATAKKVSNKRTGDKRENAFTPAKARERALIAASKTQAEKEIEVVMAQNYNADALPEVKSDTMIIHSRPVDIPLSDSTKRDRENDESLAQLTTQAMTRVDTASVPKPVESKIASSDFVSHQVKPGETLYSISQKYNCTVEQLKQWNPQLSGVLKSGERLVVRP